MNRNAQDIRQQFLEQACRYLFGQAANCQAFLRLGTPALQPIPVTVSPHRR